MEGDRVGQWRWGSPPPPLLSQGGTPIAVCWYGIRGVADEAALGVVPGSRGLMPRAEGAALDGMNPIADCWYGSRGMTPEAQEHR